MRALHGRRLIAAAFWVPISAWVAACDGFAMQKGGLPVPAFACGIQGGADLHKTAICRQKLVGSNKRYGLPFTSMILREDRNEALSIQGKFSEPSTVLDSSEPAMGGGGDAVCFDGGCMSDEFTSMEKSFEMLDKELRELSETEWRLRREGALMLLEKMRIQETEGFPGASPSKSKRELEPLQRQDALNEKSPPIISGEQGQSIISKKLAGRAGPTVWSEFGALAAQTKGVNLGQGFPNWSPPTFVTEAAVEAISKGGAAQQYTRTAGHPPLCALLAARYSIHLERNINPETEVAVTVGASQALFLVLQTLLNAGDEVLLLEPFFDLYVGQIHLAGGTPTYVPLQPDGVGGWALDIGLLRSKITPKTRVLVLNSPHNPTGKVFTQQEMESIAAVVRDTPGLIVVSDEVYKYIIHTETQPGEPEQPLGSVGHVHFAKLEGMWNRTLTVSSAGKTFSVTGWQVGWIIGPSRMVRDVQTMLPFVQFCASTPMQEALVSVLKRADQPYEGERSYYDWLRKGYVAKREKLAAALRAAGIEPMKSQGGFFLVGDTSKLKVPEEYMQETTPAMPKMTRDWALCRWLAKEYGVIGIPCSPFFSLENRHLGGNYVRFAFCKTDETLEAAKERLSKVPH